MDPHQQEILDIFTRTKALQQGHFVLRSGLHSGHYFQCAQVCQRLDTVERRTGMVVRLHVEGNPQLAAPLEDGLYRVCYEALNNTLKHSSATEVTVTLRIEGESVQLQICDNGIGFDLDSLRALNGEGIATMRERVRRMNGTLIIESAAQQGTCVNVLLKFPHQFEVDM